MVHGSLHQTRIRKISSASNALLKVFRRALAEGVTRQGWLAVEGPLLLEEALKVAAGGQVRSVLLGQSAALKFAQLLEQVPKDAEVAQIADRLFARVAQTQSPQGIAALVELPPYDLETILARRDVLLLVACGIQDPGNLGTMLRSAQAFGATALLTLKETVSVFNPKVVRSSAGAIFRMPVFFDLEAGAVAERLRAARVRLVAADRRSPAPLAQADLRGRLAVLIGRESTGLPEEVSREAHQLLSIPICPGMDSVNAATAASIFLYEAARQRGFIY
jgi:TrmH family RNA methyltransferase